MKNCFYRISRNVRVAKRLSLPELKDDVLQICHSDGSVQIEHVELADRGESRSKAFCTCHSCI